ncbi:aldo/keto reductase [Donghicola sp. C2-DW-16]|uniref:Aldo/keto reductase n=1 Tax=Donghicola mangrovi TaxID=2729614 RepID=A0ABX2PHV7_9RHOB|nr:aldo/keto reductase [Donghicola mangrovi]NVO29019.1 aldo/keto reductase [Donghicola mangrovi]
MKTRPLGRTGLDVSVFCLGSMTWGTQNTEAEGHQQIERAIEAGINFIDTAEMYPVNPVRAETVGVTEQIIGNWFEKTGRRDELILATKHSGAGSFARDGAPITAESIPQAVENSLKRLKTDVIDLYQFHWPNRGSYHFRKLWDYDPSKQNADETRQNMEDCLGALQKLVDEGKIKHFGLSNETAWGTTKWVQHAEAGKGPRVASIQNEYSLLARYFDTDLAEVCVNEDVGLLSYTSLAAGLLSGKYQNGQVPAGSRMAINGDLGGRKTDRVFDAVDAYQKLADKYGLSLVQMSLAWVRDRPGMCSVIIGATTMDQLEEVLGAHDLHLPEELFKEIDAVHKQHPLPF